MALLCDVGFLNIRNVWCQTFCRKKERKKDRNQETKKPRNKGTKTNINQETKKETKKETKAEFATVSLHSYKLIFVILPKSRI